MKKPNLTPLMSAACKQAEAALIAAIQAVDDVLGEDGAGIEHPEMVVAFMSVAGAAYTALTIRESSEAALDVRVNDDGGERPAVTHH
jgi:hypothetical protein